MKTLQLYSYIEMKDAIGPIRITITTRDDEKNVYNIA
ncbi:MAG: hypothetical protein RLZZ338_2232, partial [Cyanobacteriota bacterium]